MAKKQVVDVRKKIADALLPFIDLIPAGGSLALIVKNKEEDDLIVLSRPAPVIIAEVKDEETTETITETKEVPVRKED